MNAFYRSHMGKIPNDLIHESSPYLLQHAYNPVRWKPWNDETLKLAREENKLILVSIGYSACHWCHVMERECFEDPMLAGIMNDHFISIKVDREERPDIDQVYMLAVQLMTGRGGWPLNCFTLPDGRPFYGGTYFPREQWKNVLLNIAGLWKEEPEKIHDYADRLMEGMKISEIAVADENTSLHSEELDNIVDQWIKRSDHVYGGPDRAPKFPLPVNYNFLLHYNFYRKSEKIDKHIRLTLDKMATGGIYDAVAGGFARYSTDSYWKVPHFEKMLYDNAQLVSLYSRAYSVYRDSFYKEIVTQTLEFIGREFTGKDGEFYSALDADSEHVEGKFYVWSAEELKQVLGEDHDFFSSIFDLSENADWEGSLILLRKKIDLEEGESKKLKELIMKLHEAREKRTRPGLDDKALTSWNAMMISGYLDAYHATGTSDYLDAAIRNWAFIEQNMFSGKGRLFHSYRNGKSAVDGFLEDYAFTIAALADLYQSAFNEKYLAIMKDLMDTAMKEFYDGSTNTFYFTPLSTSSLIVRKPEINDNVIPSSGAVMARNLVKAGHMLENQSYLKIAEKLAATFLPMVKDYPEGYAHWGELILDLDKPFYEVVVSGEGLEQEAAKIRRQPYPTKILLKATGNTMIPLAAGKATGDETCIYVCSGNTCQAPVQRAEEALTFLV